MLSVVNVLSVKNGREESEYLISNFPCNCSVRRDSSRMGIPTGTVWACRYIVENKKMNMIMKKDFMLWMNFNQK